MTDLFSYNNSMPRVRPENRFEEVVHAAAEVFIQSLGYGRTQMEDIAKRAGVSKGTLYLYFESKEALFDQAVRFADSEDALPTPAELPVPTPSFGSTAEYVQHRLATNTEFLMIAEQLAAAPKADAQSEIEQIVRQLYRVLQKNRVALKLIDVCASDHPELASLWYSIGRGGVVSLLQPFIERRIESSKFVSVPDTALAARFILESCMMWGIHMHWDPHPESINREHVEETLVHFIVRGLVPPDGLNCG